MNHMSNRLSLFVLSDLFSACEVIYILHRFCDQRGGGEGERQHQLGDSTGRHRRLSVPR